MTGTEGTRRLHLKEWMKHKGIDAAAIARALGITIEQARDIKRNPHKANGETIRDIARVIGVRPDKLWSLPPNGERS